MPRAQLVITRLDRLAHSLLDLSQITAEIVAKEFELVVFNQAIYTGASPSPLMIWGAEEAWSGSKRQQRAGMGQTRRRACGRRPQ